MKLTLPMPPSMNHYWRSVVIGGFARVLLSKPGRQYQVDCQAAVLSSIGKPTPIVERCQVSVVVYPKDRRAFDIDNRLKPLLDALVHCGVIGDDAQVDRLTIERGPIAGKECRAEISIEVLT